MPFTDDDDDCGIVSPPPPPPRELIDVTGEMPLRPMRATSVAAACREWQKIAAKAGAMFEKQRAKLASRFRQARQLALLRVHEIAHLTEVARMRRIFNAAVEHAAAVDDPDVEGAGYRALDVAGFSISLWDTDTDAQRTYTYTCCALVRDGDGEEVPAEDGFTWLHFEFSADDDMDAEQAYKAKQRTGIKMTVAAERIVRCSRACLARRAAMLTDAGGLLRLETGGGVTTWVFT